MFQYGTEEFWQDLLAPSVTSVKLDLLLQLAVRLGLRTPSEPTLKFMTSWWLVASESTRELGRLTAAQKHTYLLHVKGQFHALAKLLPDPLEHLAQLPSDPLTLLRDHGAMFHNVFAEKATPVAPRIQLGDVLEFNHSYGCRGGGRHTVPATAQLAPGMPDTAVQQVADVMASQHRHSGDEKKLDSVRWELLGRRLIGFVLPLCLASCPGSCPGNCREPGAGIGRCLGRSLGRRLIELIGFEL